jgi:hypothetical protein
MGGKRRLVQEAVKARAASLCVRARCSEQMHRANAGDDRDETLEFHHLRASSALQPACASLRARKTQEAAEPLMPTRMLVKLKISNQMQ